MARENKQARHERRFGKSERLIDLALSGTWKLPFWCKTLTELESQGLMEHKRQVMSDLAKAKVIVADNICEYFYANNPKEEWHVETDFPCCAPPHDLLFIEMKRPSRILSEGTIVSSALMLAAHVWPSEVIVISDGLPQDEGAALEAAQALPGTISVLFIGDEHDRAGADFMRRLALMGGGMFAHKDLAQSIAIEGTLRGMLALPAPIAL
jgi:hypothetical protein